MKLSVIIPVYNASAQIEACLSSAFPGTPPEVEFVLVDDGSTDDSIARAERLVAAAGLSDQVRMMKHPANMGVLEARKTGIAACSGDYITFLDADDRVKPGCYARILSEIDRSPVDILTIGFEAKKDGTSQDSLFTRDLMAVKRKRVRDAFVLNTDPYLWTKVVRASLFSEISAPVADIAEDWAYTVQLFMKAESFADIDEVLYEYHVYPDSISHAEASDEQIIRRAMSERRNIAFIEELLKSTGQYDGYKKEIEARKYNVKRVLLPVSGSHRSLWLSSFREVNFRLLFNGYVPVSYKLKHVLALLGVYSLTYPLFKRLTGK